MFDKRFYDLVRENEEINKKSDLITKEFRERYLNPLIEKGDIEGIKEFIVQVGNEYSRWCARDALSDLLEKEGK